MIETDAPSYLQPYRNAARRYGAGFQALLWASRKSQAARFDAIVRIQSLEGRSLLDVGAGRADLLDFLSARRIAFAGYTGIEAMADIARLARARARALPHSNASVIDADFVKDPSCMDAHADVIVFSGSLNTLTQELFYSTLRRAFAAARLAVVFNFLSSPQLAGQPFLCWRHPADVLAFARALCDDVQTLEDYLDGDCTMVMRKPEPQ